MSDSSTLNFPSLDAAMAGFENVNPAYNNPGAIQSGNFANRMGATGTAPNGLAVFPDFGSGLTAMDTLLTSYANRGMSLSDIINKWSPANAPGNSPEATSNYVDYVSSKTGIDPSSTITGQPVSTAPSLLQKMKDAAVASVTPSAYGAAASTLFGLSIGRMGAFFLGLILIAGGIYLFKPVQNVVNTSVRGAVKTAAIF